MGKEELNRDDAPVSAEEKVSRHFIEKEIDKDLAEGVYDTVHTRFPPEPNGYLHIGHAKSILLNYGMAQQYGGKFNLRFDDTNPTKEKSEFVESIKEDVAWLGADYEDRLFFASNYFDQMYEIAVDLIKKGKAYVSDQGQECRGEPRSLHKDEKRRIRGRREDSAREDRHDKFQYEHEGSDPLQSGSHVPSQYGRQVVHLSDVRLRAPH